MNLKTMTTLSVAAALLATAGPADAKPGGLKNALFKVSVEGVQTTSWKTDHKGRGGCDQDASGSGTERVRFGSRPTTVRATTISGLSAPLLTTPRKFVDAKLRLSGKGTRQGVMNSAPGGQCGGAGGGSIPRDCGTKSFSGLKFPLAYQLASRRKDQLDFRPGTIADPFKNCPSGGSSLPTLVRSNEGAPIRADLPRSELFDRSLGKIIVIARGQESETAGEHTYLTKVRWVVTFERLGVRRR